MEIRDPIHGFVELEDVERKLLDLPVMQRLRRIKQLACANLVYPGAVHTRFDHSLGVRCIAGRIARALAHSSGIRANTAEDQRNICLAALLHDIGHGPFSHVSEFALAQFVDRQRHGIPREEEVHELIAQRIIKGEGHSDILAVLGEPQVDRVVGLLSGKEGYDYQKRIISGPLDADKQDYLLRDSHFCGVKYGVFDVERLLQTLVVREGDDGDFYLAVAEDGHHALEQFVLAKYYLTTQVYYHRIRLITDAMLERAVWLGVQRDNIQILKELYVYDPAPEYLKNYLLWTDEALGVTLLRDHPGTFAGRLFANIRNRRLWKLVFSSSVTEADFRAPYVRSKLVGELDAQTVATIEQRVAEALCCEPEFVVFKKFTLRSVRKMSRNDEASVLVEQRGELREFESVSTLFKSIDKEMNDLIIHVYAPYDYGDDRATKAKRRLEHHEKIKGILIDVLSPVEEHCDEDQTS